MKDYSYIWKINNLLYIKEVDRIFSKNRPSWFRMFLFLCDCWKEVITKITPVLDWRTKSCWCYKDKLLYNRCFKHWMYKQRIYKIWESMKSRCDCSFFSNYHGKWITYDPKRETFEWFYDDMKEWYSEELTIDRIDNNGNYCKENCRWTTRKVQWNNKSNNKIIKWKTISEWVDLWNTLDGTVRSRIRRGKPIEQAIMTIT